jgi:hypothetical protein
VLNFRTLATHGHTLILSAALVWPQGCLIAIWINQKKCDAAPFFTMTALRGALADCGGSAGKQLTAAPTSSKASPFQSDPVQQSE